MSREKDAQDFLADHPPVMPGNGLSQEAADQINFDVAIEAEKISEGKVSRDEANVEIIDEAMEDAGL